MTDTAQVAEALRKDLQKAQALWKPHEMSVADKMIGRNKVTDTQSYIKMASFTDPGLPAPRGEREPGVEMRFDRRYTTTFPAQKYLGKLSFSHEVWSDNQYRSVVVQNYAQRALDRCQDRIEITVQTHFFTDADTNTGPDGDVYASASHDLSDDAPSNGFVSAATASNIIDPPGTVGVDLLNEVFSAFQRQVDDKGLIASCTPPFDIWCHPLRAIAWKQVKTSVEEPGTPDRGNNPWGSLIGDIVSIPYATDEDRTAFVGSDHRMFTWLRESPTMTKLTYADDDSMWANVRLRLGMGEFDWRDTLFSLA